MNTSEIGKFIAERADDVSGDPFQITFIVDGKDAKMVSMQVLQRG